MANITSIITVTKSYINSYLILTEGYGCSSLLIFTNPISLWGMYHVILWTKIFKKSVFNFQYSYFWSYRCTMEITGLCAFLIILIWRSKLTMTWLEVQTIGYKWLKDVNDMISFFWRVVHHFWCYEWSTQDLKEVVIAR